MRKSLTQDLAYCKFSTSVTSCSSQHLRFPLPQRLSFQYIWVRPWIIIIFPFQSNLPCKQTLKYKVTSLSTPFLLDHYIYSFWVFPISSTLFSKCNNVNCTQCSKNRRLILQIPGKYFVLFLWPLTYCWPFL